MAFCKNCGADIGDAKFCSACGTPLQSDTTVPQADTAAPIFADPSSAQPEAQSVPTYTAPVYSAADAGAANTANTSGSLIFSIVNIVLGVFCCNIFTLILGIVAAVMTSQAKTAASNELAEQKLKTVKILNIIAVVLVALALILNIIFIATGALSNIFSNSYYGY